MGLRKIIFIQCVVIILCAGRVHNKKRNINTNTINEFGDPISMIGLDSYQFIRKFGYPSERHSVTTEDGYVLRLFRIPSNGVPVLLVHGIADSSDGWVVLGPQLSMAYQLADAGFDVWMYNARGNKYSKKHRRNIPKEEYWDFSYEEMGTKDLPATIDYILNKTSHTKLLYVGFSQGTTIFLVMCSMRPDYNDKIVHAVLLAPVAWVTRLEYPLIQVLTQNLREISLLFDTVGLQELFPSKPIQNLYHAYVCNEKSPARALCALEYYFSFGVRDINNFPKDKLPILASRISAGTSKKSFEHFIQGVSSKGFLRFDYNREVNQMLYGNVNPPAYNLSLVSVPVTLFCSEGDQFSTIYDVKTLRSKLPNVKDFVMLKKELDFTHLEFLYGRRVKKLINDPVVRLFSGIK